MRLFDTAGLRQTDDVIEAKGVEISRNLVHDADVVLYLIDSATGMNDEDKAFIETCTVPLIVVWTKTDLSSLRAERGNPQFLQASISAKTNTGLPDLFNQIETLLKRGLSTERTQAGLGSARQKESVSEALECTKHALATAQDKYTLDAVVQDIEDALDALAQVTGAITPDDVLGTIFENFCVGK